MGYNAHEMKLTKVSILTTSLIFLLIPLLSCTGDRGEIGPQEVYVTEL